MRRTLVVAAFFGLLLGLASSSNGDATSVTDSGGGDLVETVSVPPGETVWAKHQFDEGLPGYRFVVTGTSVHSFSVERVDGTKSVTYEMDALFCFSRSGDVELMAGYCKSPPSRTAIYGLTLCSENGQQCGPLDILAGKYPNVAYNASHRYEFVIPTLPGKFRFTARRDPNTGATNSGPGYTVQIYKLGKETTKTVNAPPPGGSVDVTSPPLPAGNKVDVTVSSSRDDEEDLEIYGEGDVAAYATLVFAFCWINSQQTAHDQRHIVRACIAIVKHMLQELGIRLGKGRTPAGAVLRRASAAAGCGARPLVFRASLHKKTAGSLRVTKRKLTAKSVRYTCASEDGKLKITVQTRAKGGLRKALGKRLDLRVYRSKNAARGAKLTFTFGW